MLGEADGAGVEDALDAPVLEAPAPASDPELDAAPPQPARTRPATAVPTPARARPRGSCGRVAGVTGPSGWGRARAGHGRPARATRYARRMTGSFSLGSG